MCRQFMPRWTWSSPVCPLNLWRVSWTWPTNTATLTSTSLMPTSDCSWTSSPVSRLTLWGRTSWPRPGGSSLLFSTRLTRTRSNPFLISTERECQCCWKVADGAWYMYCVQHVNVSSTKVRMYFEPYICCGWNLQFSHTESVRIHIFSCICHTYSCTVWCPSEWLENSGTHICLQIQVDNWHVI